LAPEPQVAPPRRSASAQRNPGTFDSLINRTDNESSITHCRKAPNKKVYKSSVLTEGADDGNRSRKVIGEGEFNVYNKTTQIVTLPGGVKRNSSEINDDNRNYEKNQESYNVKLRKDYSSKIACLPSTLKNDEPIVFRTKGAQNHSKRENTHNIFSTYNTVTTTNNSNYTQAYTYTSNNVITGHYSSNKENTFNVSNKRCEKDRKIFGTSNDEKKLVFSSKSKRPEHIRNTFESQISFS